MASDDSNAALLPQIQLLVFADCPLAVAAQTKLQSALQHCGLRIDDYELVDIMDSSTAKNMASWGSPTILINGRDVEGQTQGDAVGCRLYPTPDQVPTMNSIVVAIRDASQN